MAILLAPILKHVALVVLRVFVFQNPAVVAQDLSLLISVVVVLISNAVLKINALLHLARVCARIQLLVQEKVTEDIALVQVTCNVASLTKVT